jgi:hypothetical protein
MRPMAIIARCRIVDSRVSRTPPAVNVAVSACGNACRRFTRRARDTLGVGLCERLDGPSRRMVHHGVQFGQKSPENLILKPVSTWVFSQVRAEAAGFEPARGLNPPTALAV